MMVSSYACWRCFVFSFVVLFPIALLAYIISTAWIQNSDQQSGTNSTGTRAIATLKFLVVVSRHGNRESVFNFTNIPYPLNDTNHWPYGPGELTTHGRVQMYNLGTKIRTLYNGFLPSKYYNNDFYASSTATHRTLLSGETFLAGLYPPTGFQLWDKKILWQPVAMYSNSLDKTMVLSFCPKFLQEQAVSRQAYENQYASNLSAINDYVFLKTGVNLTGILGLATIWDTLISEDTEGYSLPTWTKEIYPDPMKDLTGKLYICFVAGTDELTRLVIGPFYKEMIEAMQSKVSGTLTPDRLTYYYSGHDNSLITLQAVLGIPKDSIIGLVKPGSAMIYELHQDPDTKRFSVQVLYIDGSEPDLEPVPLNIPDCGFPCDFNLLVNITQKFSNITNYDEECQVK